MPDSISPASASSPSAGPREPGTRLVVSLVIVGNEVLSGKVVEQNAAFLIGRMRTLGARVREVVFVEDDIAAIAEALARVGPRSHEVLVTGGVGPTHDDVTIQGAALALGVPVVEDPELVAQIELLGKSARGGKEVSAGERRLARVPRGATLMWGVGEGHKRIPWPVARAGNLWFFPGVPPLLQHLFDGLAAHFSSSPTRYSEALELIVEEATICEALDAIVGDHGAVEIGSYPRREAGVWHLRLTFDAADERAVKAARDAACAAFERYLSPGG